MKPISRRLLALWALLTMGAAHSTEVGNSEWNFRVLLDDKPIGVHRFVVHDEGRLRTVQIEADFAVKVLGFTAYRYRHRATERWNGDCLTHIESTTDDDGTAMSVLGELEGGDLKVVSGRSKQSLQGCLMSFAYWNPSLQTQSRLLNAQTGMVEAVQVKRLGSRMIEVHGERKDAEQFRITGPATPIDVWYSTQGEWLGLDAVVSGGHRLSYRLP